MPKFSSAFVVLLLVLTVARKSVAIVVARGCVSRRALLQHATTGGAAVGAALLPAVPAANAADALTPERLTASVVALDKLLSDWTELVTDCTYAEVPRELLETKNKELLLEKASTLATFDKSSSINVCKSTNKVVRQVLDKMPAPKQLQSPAFAALVEEDNFEAFLAASERYTNAVSAADAAAFLSATGDYSARTAFRPGETASTPNLDASRENVEMARDALKALTKLVR